MFKLNWRFVVALLIISAIALFFVFQYQRKIEYKLTDLTGAIIQSKTYQNKMVLINYWATWCAPCLREIPALVKFQKKYADKVQIIGINYDETNLDKINQFAKKMEINYPIVLKQNNDLSAFGSIMVLPTTIILHNNKFFKTKIGELSKGDLADFIAGYNATQN